MIASEGHITVHYYELWAVPCIVMGQGFSQSHTCTQDHRMYSIVHNDIVHIVYNTVHALSCHIVISLISLKLHAYWNIYKYSSDFIEIIR